MFVDTVRVGIVTAALAVLTVPTVSTAQSHAVVHRATPGGCSAASIVLGQAWELEYSFSDTFAPGIGALDIVVRSTGATTITATRRDRPVQVKRLKLPAGAMAKFVKVLTKWPPTCVHTPARKGYYMADMRSIEIKFTTPTMSTSAVVGPRTYASNPKSFNALCDAVAIVKPYMGSAATWSATMGTPIRGESCYIPLPAPNISMQRTQTRYAGSRR